MGNGSSLLPYTIAMSLVAFSVLIVQAPVLIVLRLSGMISAVTCPDWLIGILIVGIVVNGYGFWKRLFWETR